MARLQMGREAWAVKRSVMRGIGADIITVREVEELWFDSSIDGINNFEKRFPAANTGQSNPPTRSNLTTEGGFLEAWAQGYNVGSLIILILIVFCNYRSGIWLHKLILLEVRPEKNSFTSWMRHANVT